MNKGLISEDSSSIGLVSATLAGNYVIQICQDDAGDGTSTWSLFDIQDVINTISEKDHLTTSIWTDGTKAVEALKIASNAQKQLSILKEPKAVLMCFRDEKDHLELEIKNNQSSEIPDNDFLLLLQLLQSQWIARNRQPEQGAVVDNDDGDCWKLSIGSSKEIFYGSLLSDDGISTLFSDEFGIDTTSSSIEWVEMMTGSGKVIGKVPRSLVHKYNLLHRGSGVFVTKDKPIDLSSSSSSIRNFPDVYVHQRAHSKRIFPSLYDMFVGGVSLADEDSELTAQREVAEELGLSKALSIPLSTWSDGRPILTCIVCTAYNRCLVDLFQYVMDTTTEKVVWQDEEVAWGDFVSYQAITAAADLSIQRAANQGTWPGLYPPIQSELKGTLDNNPTNYKDEWKEWDFVPDGLLVWEAWIEHLRDMEAGS
jgi:8-oxo-dGTP pyrophosphatase MutT (NUDIX family)